MVLSYKLEVNDEDVSEYLIDNLRFTWTMTENVSEGTFYLDIDHPFAIKFGRDVAFYLKVDSYIKRFRGFVTRIRTDDNNNRVTVDVRGYAYKIRSTEYTGRFRDDLGNGNMKTIITNILDEKFPELTYDDDSIPDIDYDFLAKNFQDGNCGQIFDDFAELVSRIWYVDVNNKFYFISPTFTTISSVIIVGSNVHGRVIRDIDDTRFANIIKVYGKRFPVQSIQDDLIGDGTAQSFTLQEVPSASTQVQYEDGTRISTALEGAESYNDPELYDAYFKPDVPALQFNASTISGGTINVVNQTTSQIYDELPSAASIELHNLEKIKKFDSDNISSQQEAHDLAKSYLTENPGPVEVYTVSPWISTQAELEDWSTGNNTRFLSSTIDDSFNIVGEVITWNVNTGPSVALSLNNVPLAFGNRLADLLRRIYARDAREVASGSSIIKTLYWGGNVVLSLENFSIEEQNADDGTFCMQDPYVPPDDRSLMTDDEGSQLSDDVAAYYMLEGDGTDSVNDYDGTLTTTAGGQWGETGIIGDCPSCVGGEGAAAGTKSNFIAGYGNGINLSTDSVSFSAWIKVPSTGIALALGDTGAGGSRCYLGNSGGYWKIGFGSLQWSTDSDTTPVSLNTWTHIVASISSGASTTISLYVNGDFSHSRTSSAFTTQGNLGFSNFVSSDFTGTGYVDEIGLWDKALTSTDASALYNGGAGNQYPFSESEGGAIMRDDYTTSKSIIYSHNYNKTFYERFLDDFFIDLTESNGTLDRENMTYYLPDAGTLQSQPIVLSGGTYSTATATITAGTTNFSLSLKNANTEFTAGTSGEALTFGAAGEEIQYRIINTSGEELPITLVEVNYL